MGRFLLYLAGCAILCLVWAGAASGMESSAAAGARYDFEEGVPEAWSVGNVMNVQGNAVLGPFNSRNRRVAGKTTLLLGDLSPGTQVEVAFDLYLIGTWDTGGPLGDRFFLATEKGEILLEMTSFPNRFEDKEEKKAVGNTGWVKVFRRPRAYWIQRPRLSIPAERFGPGPARLIFGGDVTGRKTETWALDNVEVNLLEPRALR